MDIFDPAGFFRSFPNLLPDRVRVTSPCTDAYNCIAWAARDDRRWWWPSQDGYWPPNVPRVHTLDAFIAAYGTLGFLPCTSPAHEGGKEKIAIYSLAGAPTVPERLPLGLPQPLPPVPRPADEGRWPRDPSKIGTLPVAGPPVQASPSGFAAA